ncbi:kelch-like protein 7 [Glandiceps talaboti]
MSTKKKKVRHRTFTFQNYTCTVNEGKGSMKFVGSKHITKKTLSGQNELRKEGLMCDVVLKVDDQDIYAHRSILAVHSEYFRAMFTTEMMESRSKEVEIKEVEFHALDKLVEYMYTGVLDVNRDNVQDLLSAACMLHMIEVKDICTNCLQRYIDVTNCLGVWMFSDLHCLTELHNKTAHLFKSRFSTIIQQQEFLMLTKTRLQEILTCDDLSLGTKGEDIVLESVLKWIEYDLSNRQEDLIDLLSSVRLHLVSMSTLRKALEHRIVKTNQECVTIIKDVISHSIGGQQSCDLRGPRQPASSIYVLGGYLQSRTGGNCPHTLTIEKYSTSNNEWTVVGKLPYNLECQSAVVINGEMFFVHKKLKQPKLKIPTFTNVGTVYTLCTFNPVQNEWKTKEVSSQSVWAQLRDFKQSAVAVDKEDNVIYVCGGKEPTGSFTAKSVLKLDIENNHWSQLPSLPELRFNHSAIVVDRRLYVIGGNDVSVHIGNHRQEVKSSVFMYDPDIDSWVEKRNMNTPRLGLGLAEVNGFIYAVGGVSNTARQKTVERYEPKTDTWIYVQNMHKQRSFHSVVTFNNLIYAFGGKSYSLDDGGARTVLNSAEVYDPSTDQWTMLKSMKTARCMMSACLL